MFLNFLICDLNLLLGSLDLSFVQFGISMVHLFTFRAFVNFAVLARATRVRTYENELLKDAYNKLITNQRQITI